MAFSKKIAHILSVFLLIYVIVAFILCAVAYITVVLLPSVGEKGSRYVSQQLCVDLSLLRSTLTSSKDNSRSIIENADLLEAISKNLSTAESQAARQQIDGIAAAIRTNAGAIQTISKSYLETIERRQDGKKLQTDGLLDRNFITSAFAETSPPQSNSAFMQMMTDENLRRTIMLVGVAAITLLFVICTVLFCFTKDQEKLKFADNMIRTIIGFFIGILTAFFGFQK